MAWLSGWSYRKEITITGQSGAGTNFQVKFNIGDSAGGDFHLEGHCTNFPQDIEVTDNDGTTLLDFWIEDLTADPLKMWVKVADDLGSNQTIYIYYGKSGATTNSNISETFISGFDGDSTGWTEVDPNGHIAFNNNRLEFTSLNRDESAYVYQSNANIDGDIIIESNLELTAHATTGFVAFGAICTSVGSWDAVTDAILPHRFYYGPNVVATERVASSDDYSNVVAYAENTEYWTRSTFVRSGNLTTKLFTDSARTSQSGDDIVVDVSAAASMSYIYLIQSWDDNNAARTMTGWIDNFTVRKYLATEPAFSSAGSEETPPTGAAPTAVFYGPLVGPLGGPI